MYKKLKALFGFSSAECQNQSSDIIDLNIAVLPQEILELILKNDVLSLCDVCHFGRSCSDFWQLIKSNSSNQIWKSKFKQRWPQLMKNLMIQSHPVTDWLDSCKQRFLIGRQTMKLVNNMSALHIEHEELSGPDFKPFEELYSSSGHKLALLSIIDELMLCANHENRNTNLTSKYYCEKVLRHLRQSYLSEKWVIYKNLPPEEQLLERGAVIVAQWFQPLEEITDTAIASQLDAIADEVRERLRQEHGDRHPALLVPAELRAQWQSRNLTDNHYSPSVSYQVLTTAFTVMFQQLGSFGVSESYNSLENWFINKRLGGHGIRMMCELDRYWDSWQHIRHIKILKVLRGSRFNLGVVFESVTRRLGIKCEPITSCSGHFLLGWRDTYRPDAQAEYFYIDLYNGGTFLDKDNYPQFVTECNCCSMSPASATKVVVCMSNILMDKVHWFDSELESMFSPPHPSFRITFELSHLVNPTRLDTIKEYMAHYQTLKLDLAPLRRSVQENISRLGGDGIQIMCELDRYCDSWQHIHYVEDYIWKVKRREDDAPVKYAVGMVLRHRNDDGLGVVTGWDPQFTIRYYNGELTNSNGHQPFYHFLTWDGVSLYSPEESLELENSPEEYEWSPHIEDGRYFDRFCGTHYLPNSELERFYPDDMPVLRKSLGLP